MGIVEPDGQPNRWVANLIRKKARSLVGKYGFTTSDQESIEQELWYHLLQVYSRFDPSRGKETTFIISVVENRIRTLIEHGETDPVAFVNTLNRTIYKNAQRMKADKTLTFALINYQDGQLNLKFKRLMQRLSRKNGWFVPVSTLLDYIQQERGHHGTKYKEEK